MNYAQSNRITLFRRSLLAASVASVAMCSVALGATTGDDDHNVIVATGAATLRFNDDDHTNVAADKLNYRYDLNGTSVSVVINNGEITVHKDGKSVPADRIEKKDGQIIILDENGSKVHVMALPGKGPLRLEEELAFPGDNPQTLFVERLRAPQLAWTDAEPPAVMLGIWMDEPGEALRRHLDLKPNTTAMINGVYDGLPAEKAGIEQYDIIVKIDGHAPASPDAVREVLNTKEADDEVKLTVINRGKKKDVVVVLEPYDAERMQAAKMIGRANNEMIGPKRKFFAPGDGKNTFEFFFDEKENVIPGNMRWNIELEQLFDEKVKKQMEESVRGALKEMPKLDGEVFEHYLNQMHEDATRDGVGEQERIERLNKRLDQLERLLERLTTELGEQPE